MPIARISSVIPTNNVFSLKVNSVAIPIPITPVIIVLDVLSQITPIINPQITIKKNCPVSPTVKAVLPMVIIMGVVIGFAILVMNVGTILTAIADFSDRMRAGESITPDINLPPFLSGEFILGLKTNLILGIKALFMI